MKFPKTTVLDVIVFVSDVAAKVITPPLFGTVVELDRSMFPYTVTLPKFTELEFVVVVKFLMEDVPNVRAYDPVIKFTDGALASVSAPVLTTMAVAPL